MLRLTNIVDDDDVGADDASTVEEEVQPIPEVALASAHSLPLPPSRAFDPAKPPAVHQKRRKRVLQWFDTYKDRKTPTLLRQIWKSDWTIAAFIPMGICFYGMKLTGWPWLGVMFFMLAMSTVDAILSIFVVRLSFQQNKSGFYRTEDYERDWLRYRVLLSMTKAALLFVIGLGCGWTAMVGAHLTWFFTSCERLRYVLLRWSMSEKYEDLNRWSVFAVLREIHVEPSLRNFNIAAAVGLILGFGVTVIF